MKIKKEKSPSLKAREDKRPTEDLESTKTYQTSDSLPRVIGNYRLFQKLGEGGMGEVYEAEQLKPVRRKVAFKLIKWGMDTKQVVARFESERQALALMDHPNIARVLDAGATEQGRPYFVMECFKGVPITEYCDTHRLNIHKRFELFMQVCHGVQHAHQKGIIHRDIKPSNVLVVIQDYKPVPKIIDFGVAKATAQRLTERTVFTELGQLIGTPEYMSPEQAEMTSLDIDTRTDVYSLGALLYELLVGALPLDIRELRDLGFDEIRRKIREDEPPKPSTRLSTLGDASTLVAQNRKTDLEVLTKQLRGELDWITMKALEKDRMQRYASPSELAADIVRYLKHEPVLACPPSTLYRLKKYIRRHKTGVAAAALVILAMLIGITGTSIGLVRTMRAEKIAKTEAETAKQVSEFLVGLFKVTDPAEAKGKTITAREILDKGAEKIEEKLKDQPVIQARLMDTMGTIYENLGLYESAAQLLEMALRTRKQTLGEEHPELALSMSNLGSVMYKKGDNEGAERLSREALAMRRKLLGNEHPDVAVSMNNLATILIDKGDYEEAEQLYREALAIRRKEFGDEHEELALSMSNLGSVLYKKGDYEEAEQFYRGALAIRRKVLGEPHPELALSLSNLGSLVYKKGDYEAAEQLNREALTMWRKCLGDEHPQVAVSLNNLAIVLLNKGDYESAESLYREALAMWRRFLGDEHPNVAVTLNNLATVIKYKGDYDGAEPLFREALAMRRKLLGNEHPQVAISLNSLAMLMHDKGEYESAESLYREALAMWQKLLGDEHPDMAHSLVKLGILLTQKGDPQEAEPLLRKGLEILQKSLPEGHGRTAETKSALGGCLVALGRYENAEELLKDSYSIIKAKYGELDRRTLEALKRIIHLYEAWGIPEKAAEYRKMLKKADELPD